MRPYNIILDANILVPIYLTDVFLIGSELPQPLWLAFWTPEILREAERNTNSLYPGQSHTPRFNAMRRLSTRLLTDFEHLIPAMTNDPKDRHVLAAAVYHETGIITENLKDFPKHACEPYGVVVQSADQYLTSFFDTNANELVQIIELMSAKRVHTPISPRAIAEILAKTAPKFSERLLGLERLSDF